MTTISICGSMRFADEMEEWRKILEVEGFQVFVPGGVNDLSGYIEAGSSSEAIQRKIDNDLINRHYKYISKIDLTKRVDDCGIIKINR